MHKALLKRYGKLLHSIMDHRIAYSMWNDSHSCAGKFLWKISEIKGIGNCMLLLVPTSCTWHVPCFQHSTAQNNLCVKRNFHVAVVTNAKDDLNNKSYDPSKLTDAGKSRIERQKVDYSKIFTERNFITPLRAMNDYLLKPSDLENLRKIQRRSPFEDNPPIHVYLRRDVEQIWGSQEALQRELKKRQEEEQVYRDKPPMTESQRSDSVYKLYIPSGTDIFHVKKILKEYTRSTMHEEERKRQEMILRTSGRVVMTAVIINATNFVLKVLAWLYTGSHSMFAEAIHSLADTGNQLLLAYGIKKSLQTPTQYHPYGYHNMRYVAALVSGVGIFFLGTGLSIYHGVMGILNPDTMDSLLWAYIVLGGSLVSEGGTLVMAFKETTRGAKREGMSFAQYVLRGQDPSVNVVLLEDIASVIGIGIASGCMGLTSHTGLPIYDAVGSLAVGGLLGAVASFIIYTNTAALVGRSIPGERLQEINKEMENDVMIRAIHDVKATDMGNNYVRYKAEVDFDGRQLTRSYLDSQDLDALLEEMQRLKSIEDVESFMLKHGESIVDMLGGQIDRIEMALKKKHPEIRHVDLEVL